MPIDPTAVHRHLTRLLQRRSLDAALEFFDALGYRYADELPLPTRTWPDGIRQLVQGNAEPPLYLAAHRDFQVVYIHLTTEHLARTVERPIVEQTLHKLHPYALFLFANRDLSEWDFVNVKYVAEEDAETGVEGRRRTIRRIHVDRTERLHTAAQRLAMLAVPAPEASALELQSRHDRAFDVEEVTRQFYRDYVDVFGKLCDDIVLRNPGRQAAAATEAQVLLDRLMFLYFIQKKGWLDGQLDYLYRNFRARYEANREGTDFYDDFLLPLFVALSNEGLALPSLGDVPFLNGGLFEVMADSPLAGQVVLGNAVFKQVFDSLLECYNFTVREDTPLDVEVAIDPEMLGQVFENLVLGLERGEDRRKATGSYYTPRVIVHFMCRQALKEYLAAESGLDPDRIEALMELGPAEQLTAEEVAQLQQAISEPEARLLRGLIEGLRALDPAVGSGAFLLGMLYEMVALTRLLDVRLYGQARVRRRNYDYDLKRGFIERNLYGVDIQPEAVRICELRLWLSLMVEYERQPGEAVPTLPNLSYRVRVGDSLIERLFGEPVQLDELANDAVARQLVDRIQAEKRAYFQEPGLWEKQRRELRILGLMSRLTTILIQAKRQIALRTLTAEVPQMGDAFLSAEQRKLKEALETEVARYDRLLAQAKGVYDRVQAMQDGRAPLGTRDVGALREELELSFIWRLDFAEVFADKGGFDIVVGNPPYGIVFDELGKHYLEWLYPTFLRNNDVYVAFSQKGVDLLKVNGVFGYIMPNTFLLGPYFDGLKRYILQKADVQCIVDLGTNQVFKDPNVFTALLFLKRLPPGPRRRDIPRRFVRVSDLGLFSDIIEYEPVDQTTLESLRWSPLGSLENRMFDIGLPLDEIAWVKDVGLNYWTKGRGKVRGGSIADRVLYEGQQRHPQDKPYLKGRDVGRYSLDFGNHWLRHDYQDRLNSDVDTFRFSPEYLEREKIVYRQTADRIIATLDPHGMLTNKTLHTIVLRDEWMQATDLRYLLGILNSSLLTFLYRAISKEEGRTFAQVKTFRLKELPIKIAIPGDSVSETYCSRVLQLVEHMLALHQELSSVSATREADLAQEIAATDAEIDALVYELYGLTEEEIAIVEGR